MNDPEVLVIGGGPAGSCAAATLARRGRRVVQLELERGPRYHIGESLIPFCAYPLRRIGFIEKLERSRFPKKYSVSFVGTTGTMSRPFYFYQYLYDGAAVTWQVPRQEFDEMLLVHAGEQGVDVRRGHEATAFIIDDGVVRGARVRGPDGVEREIRAPITIDCSGRESLSHRTFAWRELDPGLDRFALWTYVTDHRLDPGIDGAATVVASVPEGGWFWWIPMADGKLSCGVVARKDWIFRESKDLEAAWTRAVDRQPWIAERLAGTRRAAPLRMIAEYSYRAKHAATDGLLVAGDAFGFLDPLFSSGVFLALRGAELAAAAADAALTRGTAAAEAFAEYGATMTRGIESIRTLVHAFYQPRFSFNQVMTRDPYARADISDLLNGCFFRDYERFFALLREFAEPPPAMGDGSPVPRARVRSARGG